MGIPTLINTLTASNSSSLADTSSMTSTYDEYMFVCTDIGPATNSAEFGFQVNADGESGYNEQAISTYFEAYHNEGGTSYNLDYVTTHDLALGTGLIELSYNVSSDADSSCAGILHIFSPSNTTFVTNFMARFNEYEHNDYTNSPFIAGYINVAAAITGIEFKMSTGNFDGVIQMYGIA